MIEKNQIEYVDLKPVYGGIYHRVEEYIGVIKERLKRIIPAEVVDETFNLRRVRKEHVVLIDKYFVKSTRCIWVEFEGDEQAEVYDLDYFRRKKKAA